MILAYLVNISPHFLQVIFHTAAQKLGKEMEGKKVSLHQVGEWTCNIAGYALIWFFSEKLACMILFELYNRFLTVRGCSYKILM